MKVTKCYMVRIVLWMIAAAAVGYFLAIPCKLCAWFQGVHPGCLSLLALPAFLAFRWREIKWHMRRYFLAKQKIC